MTDQLDRALDQWKRETIASYLAPHDPPMKRDDLIDAGLTPRADECSTFTEDNAALLANRAVTLPTIQTAPRFLEAPYERAAHALLDAVGESAVAIWTAPSREDVLTFRDTLESSIGNLMAQSVAAQTLADNWDTRGNK